LEQLSPQKYELFGDIALSNANLLSLEVDNRLNNMRDGSESVDTTGMGGSTDKVTSGYSKDDKAEAPVSSLKDRRWGFFASATGLRANLDGNIDLQSAAFTSVGLISGIDGKIGDDALIGLLFDYNNTSADLDNQGSTAKVESYSGGLYGAYHRDGFYTNGLLAYTRNDYNTARNILIPGFNQTATGSSHGNQYTVNIDGGYDHKISYRFTVGPIAGVQYVHLDTDSFNESGAGAASLAVGSQTVESLRSKLGVRANYHLQVDKDLAIALEVRAAWQHEFLDDSRSFNSSFINSGLSSFSVSTSKPQRDAALVGIGIDATIADRFTVYVDYDVQAGQSGYIEHTFKGGCKISF
jgi:outer membrane autotransporter protein